MKNSADLGGCYPPSASVDNTLLYLQNYSYPTQPHSIIAKYTQALISTGNGVLLTFYLANQKARMTMFPSI